MKPVRLMAFGIFLSASLIYAAWMTGFTFIFSECRAFPNYAMLADGFAKGHLYIQEAPPADTILQDGRRYIFSGPVPALLRLPTTLIFGLRIPSGLMIVLFCAGVSMFFALILDQIGPAGQTGSLSPIKSTFMLTFMGGGVSLFMVSIPSIHHESISAAMFFLMAAVYFLLDMQRRGCQASAAGTLLFALSLALCVGSRFSYVYAAAVLGGVFIFSLLKKAGQIPKRDVVRAMVLIVSVGMASLFGLLLYNYLRFGAFLDFGMKGLTSLYQNYFIHGGYFRYDHFPHNIWSLFFRIPEIVPEFPFLKLPGFILQVQSVGIGPYLLIHTNELTISVFLLMPILLLAFMPASTSGAGRDSFSFVFICLSLLLMAQILSVAFTVAAIARYYYDFVPILTLMAFGKTVQLRTAGKISTAAVVFLGAFSLIVSLALPINAVKFYEAFIDYRSPLLRFFF